MKERNPEVDLLRRLLSDYVATIRNPLCCRMIILSRISISDELIRATVLELVLNNGDWQAAKSRISSLETIPSERRAAIVTWGDKIQEEA